MEVETGLIRGLRSVIWFGWLIMNIGVFVSTKYSLRSLNFKGKCDSEFIISYLLQKNVLYTEIAQLNQQD